MARKRKGKNRLNLDFDGFAEVMEKLASLEADMKKPVEEALQVSAEIVTEKIREEMKPHNFTKRTINSLKKPKVRWYGDNYAEVEYGFSIREGGLASIFLEHGTPKQAPTPIIKPAISKTRKKVRAEQERILTNALREAGGDES